MIGLESLLLSILARLFGGVTRDLRLTEEEAGRMHAQTRPVRVRFYFVGVPVAVLLALLAAWGLVMVRSALEGPAVNPLVDQRPSMRWLGFGSFCGFAAMLGLALIEMRHVPRRCGWTCERYIGYCMAQHGWHPRNFIVMLLALTAPLFVLFAGVGWSVGTRIDEHGVAFDSYLFLRPHYPHAQVASVRVSRGADVCAMTFRDGRVFEYRPESDEPDVVAVGNFVASRAGVQVVMSP